MIPKELFQKIKRIEISTSRLVSDIFAGQYHSVFKGQGIEFDEVREYQLGDDIRTIDWNVTARTGKPHVKKFIEERELTVMLLVDASSSCQFASVNTLKNQLAAEISAVLALSATKNNDKVGLIIFTDKIEKFIPPRKGKQHVLRVIREVLHFKPQSHSTDIIQAVEYLNRVTKRKTISFLVSDFFLAEKEYQSMDRREALKKTLAIANKRHDMIAITLNDPIEKALVDCGLVMVEDAETQTNMLVDTSSKDMRDRYFHSNEKRIKDRQYLFASLGVDYIDVSTETSYVDEIVKFFLKRRHV